MFTSCGAEQSRGPQNWDRRVWDGPYLNYLGKKIKAQTGNLVHRTCEKEKMNK